MSPGDQVGVTGESAHVDSDFPEERRNADLAHSGHQLEPFDELSKGVHRLGDVEIELGNGAFDALDEAQMHPQQSALLIRGSTLEGLEQSYAADTQPRVGQIGEPFRIRLAGDQSLDDGASADP